MFPQSSKRPSFSPIRSKLYRVKSFSTRGPQFGLLLADVAACWPVARFVINHCMHMLSYVGRFPWPKKRTGHMRPSGPFRPWTQNCVGSDMLVPEFHTRVCDFAYLVGSQPHSLQKQLEVTVYTGIHHVSLYFSKKLCRCVLFLYQYVAQWATVGKHATVAQVWKEEDIWET